MILRDTQYYANEGWTRVITDIISLKKEQLGTGPKLSKFSVITVVTRGSAFVGREKRFTEEATKARRTIDNA